VSKINPFESTIQVSKNVLQGYWGPGSKQEIAFVNLVPRSLTDTFFKHPGPNKGKNVNLVKVILMLT
jgi:hypothetical protein